MDENNLLMTPYTEDEARKAIFQMEHNKVPVSDGFPTEFYQTFWETIKADLLELFGSLHARHRTALSKFGYIILLPKVNEAKMIQQYRLSLKQ
jgi:hypothetical protein